MAEIPEHIKRVLSNAAVEIMSLRVLVEEQASIIKSMTDQAAIPADKPGNVTKIKEG